MNSSKNLNHYVSLYKEQLQKGDILIAYNQLVKFVMEMRVRLIKNLSDDYSFSGILYGYLDYTYFYYQNVFLKSKKLKLGLVLNHVEMQFEIWLLGNTKPVQSQFWDLLKDSKWNKDKEQMPEYSILESVIVLDPDFDKLDSLANDIEQLLITESKEIIDAVEGLNQK